MKRRIVAWVWVALTGLSAGQAGERTLLRVGHVGHDHHIALFIAADRGEKLRDASGGVWFKELKRFQVYELRKDGNVLAQVMLKKVGGGANMPAGLARNEIEVGLGGVAATVAAIDKGATFKIIAPCNCDGDMLLVRPDFPAKDWPTFLAAVRDAEAPVKIGYKAPRAVAYLIFMAALKASGVTYGPKAVDEAGQPVQVVLVNLQKGSNMAPSLQADLVDGIVMNQPVVAVAAHKKLGRVIADLCDLPPEGQWANHPCCCVVASAEALADKAEAVEALLQAIVAGGRFIASDPKQAIQIAAAWTKKPLAVEQKSIPTVTYVTVPGTEWRQGMRTWFAMMKDLGQFTKRLKDKTPEEMHALVSDYTLIERAAAAVAE